MFCVGSRRCLGLGLGQCSWNFDFCRYRACNSLWEPSQCLKTRRPRHSPSHHCNGAEDWVWCCIIFQECGKRKNGGCLFSLGFTPHNQPDGVCKRVKYMQQAFPKPHVSWRLKEMNHSPQCWASKTIRAWFSMWLREALEAQVKHNNNSHRQPEVFILCDWLCDDRCTQFTFPIVAHFFYRSVWLLAKSSE